MRYPYAFSKTLAVISSLVTLAAGLVLGVAATTAVGVPAAAAQTGPSGGSPGYWLVGNGGQVYQVDTTNYGDLRGVKLDKPVVGGAATDDGMGYWLVASDGGIFAYGDAGFHGSTGGIKLNQPIVAMAADPVTGGYWFVASDGGVFAFGAPFLGSTGGVKLDKPVVGMAATPDGRGYWLVASDGGVFAFGDAHFHGSTGGIPLQKPVVGMAATPDGNGYWMVASDGGIFSFGDAGFHGSTGRDHLVAPVVGMQASASGNGYWLAASDGGVFPFGDAPFLGTAGTNGTPPIVAMMSTDSGYPFPPGSTGYDVSQYQCPDYQGHVSGLPPTRPPVAVVQVSGGAINQSQPATCYPEEASWAGPGLSAYIYMDGLPSPAPTESMTGPAGNCSASNVNCQSYNFGYYWAEHWVNYAHADNTQPTLWWLDVETTGNAWNLATSAQSSNSQVIAGAVAGLRASGVTPGIYATNLQWGQITGDDVSFPHIPLWVPGATTVSDAQNMCTSPDPNHAPFAGGTTVLIQYGYGNVPAHTYDEDYACK